MRSSSSPFYFLALTLLANSATAVESCDFEGCTLYNYWRVGNTTFQNGKHVVIAETSAYHGDEEEHSLAFVFDPEDCSSPTPYLRFQAPNTQASYQLPINLRFRVNANKWYEFQGKLFFPSGRVGTGLLHSINEMPEEFSQAVAYGETLDSISFRADGSAVHHEYNLQGSREAMKAAHDFCASIVETPQIKPAIYQLAMPVGTDSEQGVDPSKINTVATLNCHGEGLSDNPAMASSFSQINTLLLDAIGADLEQLSIPIEYVCQDLQAGYSPRDLAESIITKALAID